jgi:hypothetical protein
MDYREALRRKVYWEKETKPSIKKSVVSLKEKLLLEEEKQNGAKECLRKLKQARPYYIDMINTGICAVSINEEKFEEIKDFVISASDKEMSLEQYDILVKKCEYKINSNPTRVKCMKKELCVISHIYNGNIQFAIENLHKFKDEAHKCIEDVDGLVEYATYAIDGEQSCKEGGYNEYCKMFKRKIKLYENLIEELSLLKGEVKQILKANRRVNERMN